MQHFEWQTPTPPKETHLIIECKYMGCADQTLKTGVQQIMKDSSETMEVKSGEDEWCVDFLCSHRTTNRYENLLNPSLERWVVCFAFYHLTPLVGDMMYIQYSIQTGQCM